MPPRISGYLRITIGTPDQMQRFLTALDEIFRRVIYTEGKYYDRNR